MKAAAVLLLALGGVASAQNGGDGDDDDEQTGSADLQGVGGLGKGLEFTTADERSRMQIRMRMQLRFSELSDEPGGAPDVTEFQVRRARVLFRGYVLGGDLEYYLQLGFSNRDTEEDLRLPLRDAYVTYTRVRDLHVRGGQMKVPYGRQRVISSAALQFPDRSIVTNELNLDRDVGVQALSEDLFGLDGRLGYHAGVFSGDGRNRLAPGPGVLVVGRIAARPLGKFDDFVEADLEHHESPKLAVGLGAAYNFNTIRSRSTFMAPYELADFDYRHLGADAIFKLRGLSVLGELMYRRSTRPFEDNLLPSGEVLREYARNAWGGFVQAGFLFTRKAEVVARYGELRPLGETAPELAEPQRELGGGLGYYFSKHDLKLQGDYFYLFGPDLGLGRHEIRVQMQLFY